MVVIDIFLVVSEYDTVYVSGFTTLLALGDASFKAACTTSGKSL
jgi:hypothetical protein